MITEEKQQMQEVYNKVVVQLSRDRYFRGKLYRSTTKTCKLYQLSRDVVVSHIEEPEVLFLFSHVDGMYSYCETNDGGIYYPAAWCEVILWEEVQ